VSLQRLRRRLLRRLLAALIPPLYRLWAATLRYEEIGREALDALDARGECAVICLWHGEIFTVWKARRQLKVMAMISQSRDGDILSRLAGKSGFHLARGSISKGGAAALRAMAQAMKEEHLHPCIALDGPRGPFHRIRDGAFFLAHYSGGWMMPVRIFHACSVTLGSWDRFSLPLPFSRVRLAYAAPYRLETAELNEETLNLERDRLRQKLDALGAHAFPA